MSAYVDDLMKWPTKIRCFKGGSCHLMADSVEELHAFARQLGMKRSWFQDRPGMPHYDLTPTRRATAVRLGAVEVDRYWVAARLARQQHEQPEEEALKAGIGPLHTEN